MTKLGRHYSSYLIRRWCVEGQELRIEIEHIQTGYHDRLSSLADIVGWIEHLEHGADDEQITQRADMLEHHRSDGLAQARTEAVFDGALTESGTT